MASVGERSAHGPLSTTITTVSDEALEVRGIPAQRIISEFDFEAMTALVLGLELDHDDRSVLRACLVANPDHGLASNGVTAAVAAAATSRDGLAGPVAAGLLAMGSHTISPRATMVFLAEAVREWRVSSAGVDEAASRIVRDAAASRTRLPGFGSPVHPGGDPRVQPLADAAVRAGRWGDHCRMFSAIGDALGALGRAIPPNEVGMMAACLADIGLTPDQGEAVAVIGTVPSLLANILLERERPPRFLVATAL